jgi:hypothetical protein
MSKAGRIKQRIKWEVKTGSLKGIGITVIDLPVIEEWIRRLESGEYSQAEGKLRDSEDAMCCLGVLEEMGVEQGLAICRFDETRRHWEYRDVSDNDPYHWQHDFLTQAVMEWAGLENRNPSVKDLHMEVDDYYTPEELEEVEEPVELSELNDSYNRDFSQIAEDIRAEYITAG